MARTPVFIQGIQVATPPQQLRQELAAETFARACPDVRTVRWLRRLARLSEVQTRHLASLAYQVGPEQQHLYRAWETQPHGPGMEARNARFLEVAGPLVERVLTPFGPVLADVEALVTVSCTHVGSPGLERHAFAHAPLRATVDRWHLGFMGCSAGLAALRLVWHGGRQPALILACELSSLHFQYDGKVDQLTANVLFADGAAALLTGPRPQPARIVGTRSVALPAAADQMEWWAGDHGLRLHLAEELPATLAAHLPAALQAFLDDLGVARRDIAHWLVHPGGPQVLERAAAALALPDHALQLSRDVLRRYGNMSSPTILFILREWLARREPGLCVALAFGPGLTIELVLLDVRT